MDRESRGYGRILATPKIGWEGTDVIGPLAEVFDAPIVLMTDVTGALKAEALWGAARHFDDVVYLTIGTGIGAGILSGGRVLAGTGYPEIGHLPVRRHPSDRFDGVCRFHGDCVEGLASGPAIGARWGAGLPDLGGDELRQAMELEEFYTGQIISALHYTLGTRRFIVGGGVANWTGLRSGIASAAAELVGGGTDPHKDGDLLSVVAPELGGLAGVTGALAAAGELVNRDR
jgi:fructokinase